MPRKGVGEHGGAAKWKHGWIPVNAAARAIVARRKARALAGTEESSSVTDWKTKRQLPNHLVDGTDLRISQKEKLQVQLRSPDPGSGTPSLFRGRRNIVTNAVPAFLEAGPKVSGPHTAEQDAINSNPGYFQTGDPWKIAIGGSSPDDATGPWKVNCYNCIQAYELRRRGYAVQAQPASADDYYFGAGQSVAQIASGWETRSGEPARFESVVGGATLLDRIDAWPAGSRGWISNRWVQGGHIVAGHVFAVEKDESGQVHFLDPQPGREVDKFDYLSRSDPHFDLMRTDELVPKDRVANQVENSGTLQGTWRMTDGELSRPLTDDPKIKEWFAQQMTALEMRSAEIPATPNRQWDLDVINIKAAALTKAQHGNVADLQKSIAWVEGGIQETEDQANHEGLTQTGSADLRLAKIRLATYRQVLAKVAPNAGPYLMTGADLPAPGKKEPKRLHPVPQSPELVPLTGVDTWGPSYQASDGKEVYEGQTIWDVPGNKYVVQQINPTSNTATATLEKATSPGLEDHVGETKTFPLDKFMKTTVTIDPNATLHEVPKPKPAEVLPIHTPIKFKTFGGKTVHGEVLATSDVDGSVWAGAKYGWIDKGHFSVDMEVISSPPLPPIPMPEIDLPDSKKVGTFVASGTGDPRAAIDFINDFDELNPADYSDRQHIKDRVVTRVSGLMAGELNSNPELLKAWNAYKGQDSYNGDRDLPADPAEVYSYADSLNRTWATTSGDSNELAVATQMQASRTFGLPVKFTGELADYAGAETTQGAEQVLEREGPFIDLFLRSAYRNTQDELQKHGVPEKVPLYRGMHFGEENAPSWVKDTYAGDRRTLRNVSCNPLSSWAADNTIADAFAGSDGSAYSVVMQALVPRDSIFSTARTGPGCSNEHEFVVLGAHGTAHANVSGYKARVKSDKAGFAPHGPGVWTKTLDDGTLYKIDKNGGVYSVWYTFDWLGDVKTKAAAEKMAADHAAKAEKEIKAATPVLPPPPLPDGWEVVDPAMPNLFQNVINGKMFVVQKIGGVYKIYSEGFKIGDDYFSLKGAMNYAQSAASA